MTKITHSLFWRLSFFFLFTLLLLAGIFVYITYHASQEFAQETSQKLHRELATWIADHTNTFDNGEPNEEEMKSLFGKIMIVNPSVEVYFLNNEGKILTYFAPQGKVQLDHVNIDPIDTFLADDQSFIKGEDPRNPGEFKIFSAAPIVNNSQQVGYLYVILASEEYSSVVTMLQDSFKMKLATQSILIALLFTLIFGITMIYYLTKNLNRISTRVDQFKQGDLKARIQMKKNKGELSQLAHNIDAMADTIVENINEIKSVENLRKELIANVSHDLRTPLTAIQGYAETLDMLQDKLSDADRKKYTRQILSSTEMVKKLVDDLFEISKLESKHIKTKMEAFSIHEMISDIVMKYGILAESKNIELVFSAQKNWTTKADIALIDRVIQNLLDNAIKHSPANSIVTIETRKIGNELQISVKDTGLGIPHDEIPYIFDRYKKAKNNHQKGSGLGLAIVKKILDLHKSSIEVQSDQDKGTVFWFTLPLVNPLS